MKMKLKYEEGRFLKNDRKDNEIVILRGENTNLKQSIKSLEEKIKEFELKIEKKDKKILELQEDNNKIKNKIKEIQKWIIP
jgi:peptidoglycan hydrolase CwlO-like protein